MKRLDLLLTEKGLTESRTRANDIIKKGAVRVNGVVVKKPSALTDIDSQIIIDSEYVCPYVSRGGLKLEGALDSFMVSVNDLVCLDVGASTGGFTDCLLQRGAKRVYAIDSGSAQLHPSLLSDDRVISLENLNAKEMSRDNVPELIDLCVMDVSFISQVKLYPSIIPLLNNGATLITLIKPQFEVGRSGISKGGIVKDEKLRSKVVSDVIEQASLYGLENVGVIVSPIRGGDGNVEFLSCFKYKCVNN